jgi:hypothetical protein
VLNLCFPNLSEVTRKRLKYVLSVLVHSWVSIYFPHIILCGREYTLNRLYFVCTRTALSKVVDTSMLVPGDPGCLGTHIYVFTVESQQPVGARHTSYTQLLWKPRGPSREDTRIYLVTFETSQLVGARNTSCKQWLWKPRDPSKEGTHIYLFTFENSRRVGARNTSCTQLLRKPRDPGRQGTLI